MIYIGADYAGYKLKEKLKKYFDSKKIKYFDVGTHSDKKKNDFTDFIPPVVNGVKKSSSSKGVLICGTGYGMQIGSNRFKKIRATIAHNPKQAKWAKTHDDSNILVLSSWSVNKDQAIKIFNAWHQTKFNKLARRVRRFKTIDRWRS